MREARASRLAWQAFMQDLLDEITLLIIGWFVGNKKVDKRQLQK